MRMISTEVLPDLLSGIRTRYSDVLLLREIFKTVQIDPIGSCQDVLSNRYSNLSTDCYYSAIFHCFPATQIGSVDEPTISQDSPAWTESRSEIYKAGFANRDFSHAIPMTEPKSKRNGHQPYIPVHRRNVVNAAAAGPPPADSSPRLTRDATQNGNEVVRRGRGKFRAPGPQQDTAIDDNGSCKMIAVHSEARKEKDSLSNNTNVGDALAEIQKDVEKLEMSEKEQGSEQKQVENSEEMNEPRNIEKSKEKGIEAEKSEGMDKPKKDEEVKEADKIDEAGQSAAIDECKIIEEQGSTEINEEVEEVESNEQSIEENESEKEEWETLLDELDDSESEMKPAAHFKEQTSKQNAKSNFAPMDDEPTVVLDCFDFPPTFKTHHIHDIFREYEQLHGGYRIKWRAYIENVSNPLAKVRPYTGPLDFMKGNAGPIPRRPTTTDMVARRLVHGALGVKGPSRTAEQRQAEKDMLKAARVELEGRRRSASRRTQDLADAFNE
ncbi:Coiled-coil domain-containing protein r3hcc1l [Apophysomyces ossiformis]|uniref:Coiled-coil domain-containing protein r3hcc1l n=1 Tax=Apophysomyces ossiformis TaxID=679940 RepID=A0A8H7ESJ6_9FUNG|nr:Coiled-coil domain-containing protein r3hcc1l [Apophysomyces ossiformis]